VLDSPNSVVRALLTYTDWWQPATTSILQVGVARRRTRLLDGFRGGLLDTLDERAELSRRVSQLGHRDRQILYFWYVAQISPREMARRIGISARQCYRRRGQAIRTIVELGDPSRAA
jgi:DNA-directed RNA polymerase specialized sigma24 family protein